MRKSGDARRRRTSLTNEASSWLGEIAPSDAPSPPPPQGVKNGFPLAIRAEKVEVEETDFNEEFIRHMLPKIEWNALRAAAAALEVAELPEALTEALTADAGFLQVLHHVLLEVHVIQGTLVCPESGREFPIQDGVPNMLLAED